MEKVVPKIGLFICDTGGRLGRTIDLPALTAKLAKAKGVSRCEALNDPLSPASFDSIKSDVRNGAINRILWVGRFTPDQMKWIENELAAAGLNPYLHEWRNLEEQGIGVSGIDSAILNRKAQMLIQMSLARTRLLVPLEPVELPASDAVLIIGAGVAGIHTAVTLAKLGKRVHLLEKESGVGGKVALLSRFYPLLCDPHCGLEFAIDELANSDLVEIHTLSRLVSLEGSPGNFEARFEERPRRVNQQRCNACGVCLTACPVQLPVDPRSPDGLFTGGILSEGIGELLPPKPQAIHPAAPMPFPSAFAIDREYCPQGCRECEKVCPTQAVELDQTPREHTLRVGAVLVTTGWDPYPLSKVAEFGYGRLTNVISNIDMEILCKESGNNGGIAGPVLHELKDVGFIQCAGSRDERHLKYCSSVCCSATLKQVLYFKEGFPDTNCYVFYIDIRSPAFDEDLYRRARNLGVVFNRELPSRVITDPVSGKLTVQVVDPTLKETLQVNLDLLVLAGGMTPSQETADVAQVLKLPQNSYGFFESHYQCHPDESQRTGLFVAGCAREPMKVSHAIESAHMAALKALRFLEGSVLVDPAFPVVDKTKCDQCKRCMEECPYSAFAFDEKGFPTPDLAKCRQCGNCMGLCPLAVVSMGHNTVKQTAAQIGAINTTFMGGKEPTVLAFLCKNDAYKAARAAADRGFAVPPNVIFLKLPCAGALNNALIADALSAGIDGVLVGGCPDGQCHYVKGSQLVQKRSGDLADKLKKMMIDPSRVKFVTLEIRDSRKYVDLLQSYVEELKAMGPNPFKI
ncbi:MAG: hydrogenase iron-sulfur subunit [Deltaproteobacteria bacterium]|nr:hydrogenase iron-sulfur subunit [Deltaproteobacteria bacterium]